MHWIHATPVQIYNASGEYLTEQRKFLSSDLRQEWHCVCLINQTWAADLMGNFVYYLPIQKRMSDMELTETGVGSNTEQWSDLLTIQKLCEIRCVEK